MCSIESEIHIITPPVRYQVHTASPPRSSVLGPGSWTCAALVILVVGLDVPVAIWYICT